MFNLLWRKQSGITTPDVRISCNVCQGDFSEGRSVVRKDNTNAEKEIGFLDMGKLCIHEFVFILGDFGHHSHIYADHDNRIQNGSGRAIAVWAEGLFIYRALDHIRERMDVFVDSLV